MKFIFYNTFYLVILINSSFGQSKFVYTIGVVGGGLNINNYSSPLLLDINNCIKISNGLVKFSNSNTAEFINDCVVNLNYSRLSIQVNPNPFIESVYVKLKTKIDINNKFKISIFNNTGQLLKIFDVNQITLYTGFRIQLSDLTSGIYFMQIQSNKVNEIFKMEKIQ
jgi:hypothetical protein